MKTIRKRCTALVLALLVTFAGMHTIVMTASAADEGTDIEAALRQAIDRLPDAVQLYYYTDEAILRVAHALGHQTDDADAFIRDAIANGYRYEGEHTAEAIRDAVAMIDRLASSVTDDPVALNALVRYDDWSEMCNRDESKAHATITTVPCAVNGKALDPCATVLYIRAGDRITFRLDLQTDFYVSSMLAQIVYDCTAFRLVDEDGTAYTQEELLQSSGDGLMDFTPMKQSVYDKHYDCELLSKDSFAKQYPEVFKYDEYMERYKILAVSIGTKYAPGSRVFRIGEETPQTVCTFTVEAQKNLPYNGSNAYAIGCPESWYATPQTGERQFRFTRAAGYLADGTTPASSYVDGMLVRRRDLPASACGAVDLYAMGGQTYTSVTEFGTCIWDDGVIETPPTCSDEGVMVYTCTICGDEKREVIEPDPNAHRWGDWENENDEQHIRYCVYDFLHTETEAHQFREDTSLYRPATEYAQGQRVYFCTVCNHQKTEIIPKRDHTWYDGVVTLPPTCSTQGVMEFTCTGCGATMTEPIAIDPDAHVWDDGTIIREATETANGEKQYTCTLCGATTVSEYPYIEQPTLCVDVGSGTAHRSDTVTVSVLLRNNPGVSGTRIYLDYDPAVLELESVANGTVFDDTYFTHSKELSNRPFVACWLDRQGDRTQDGALISFTFRVLRTAPRGSTAVQITYDKGSSFNADLQLVPFRVRDGMLQIKPLFGDVNNDESVDAKDAVVLQRYLAEWKDVAICFENADVNEDGAVDLRDLFLIVRFIVGGYGVNL